MGAVVSAGDSLRRSCTNRRRPGSISLLGSHAIVDAGVDRKGAARARAGERGDALVIIGIGARRASLFSGIPTRRSARRRARRRPRVVVARQHLAAMEVQPSRAATRCASSSCSRRRRAAALRPPAASIRAAAKAGAVDAAAARAGGAALGLGAGGGVGRQRRRACRFRRRRRVARQPGSASSRLPRGEDAGGRSSTGEATFNEWVLADAGVVHAAWARTSASSGGRSLAPPRARPGRVAQAARRRRRRRGGGGGGGRLQRAWRRFTNRQIFRYFAT